MRFVETWIPQLGRVLCSRKFPTLEKERERERKKERKKRHRKTSCLAPSERHKAKGKKKKRKKVPDLNTVDGAAPQTYYPVNSFEFLLLSIVPSTVFE